ncbi:hypothetical protein ES703_77328 [subsurface metagenome]
MLDPIVESWAKEAGMKTADLSNIIGGNVIGGLIGVPMDMFLTALGSKIASFFVGAAGLLFGTYTMKGQDRMQRDVMQISARVLTEFLDPSPDDIRAIQKQIGNVVDGVAHGRWDKVAYAFIRSPRDFQGLIPGPTKQKASEGGLPKPDEQRAMNHYGITAERWNELTTEEKQAYINTLPPPGTGRIEQPKSPPGQETIIKL